MNRSAQRQKSFQTGQERFSPPSILYLSSGSVLRLSGHVGDQVPLLFRSHPLALRTIFLLYALTPESDMTGRWSRSHLASFSRSSFQIRYFVHVPWHVSDLSGQVFVHGHFNLILSFQVILSDTKNRVFLYYLFKNYFFLIFWFHLVSIVYKY